MFLHFITLLMEKKRPKKMSSYACKSNEMQNKQSDPQQKASKESLGQKLQPSKVALHQLSNVQST